MIVLPATTGGRAVLGGNFIKHYGVSAVLVPGAGLSQGRSGKVQLMNLNDVILVSSS